MGEVPLYRYTGMTHAEIMPLLENVDVLIISSTYCGAGTGTTGALCEVMTTQTNSLSLLSLSFSLSLSHTLALPPSINPFLPPSLLPPSLPARSGPQRERGGGLEGGEESLC